MTHTINQAEADYWYAKLIKMGGKIIVKKGNICQSFFFQFRIRKAAAAHTLPPLTIISAL